MLLHHMCEPPEPNFTGSTEPANPQGGNDYIAWFRNGRLHRDNYYPAVFYNDGRVEYWVNGRQTTDEVLNRIERIEDEMSIHTCI